MPKIKSKDLQVNSKVEATAPDTTLIIEVDARKRLRVGAYVFQLQVTDDANNVSSPASHTVIIVDETKPTAVINGPQTVPLGRGFTLSGERSFDPDDGKIKKYVWTLIQAP